MSTEEHKARRMEFRVNGDRRSQEFEDVDETRIQAIEHELLARRFKGINVSRGESYARTAETGDTAALDSLEEHFKLESEVVFEDSRALAEEIYTLEQEGKTDELTGAFTEEGVKERFETEKKKLDINPTSEDSRILFVSFDIDGFKAINDDKNRGHVVGDNILKEVVEQLQKWFRPTDIVGRPGGDEFVMVLTNVPQTQVQIIADRVKTIAEFVKDRAEGTISISGGVYALSPGEEISFETARERADKAGNIAKIEGSPDVKIWKENIEPDLSTPEKQQEWAELLAKRKLKRDILDAERKIQEATTSEGKVYAEKNLAILQQILKLREQMEMNDIQYEIAEET
jgi:diguanylate cyclase (GGDEF)-like protein